MTKYLVSGYIGFDNFGDEAIAKVVTSKLKDLQAEKITLLSSNPEKTAKLYEVNSEHYLRFFKPILETDVLISGGGSLLQDITSLKSLIYYLAVIVTALVFNKKVIIFAQGFTPFRTKIGEIFTKFVLNYCHKIYVRDLKSQELLKKMDIESILVADPVYDLKSSGEVNHSGVGVQLRSFPTITDGFLEKLANKIAEKFPNEEIKIYSLQDSLDYEISQKFQNLLESKNVKSKFYNKMSVETAINELSNLEYLIGMRFHADLVAAKAGVKVLGINYDVKVLNLSKHIGFPILGLEQEEFNKEFEELISLDTSKYNIPTFEFPEI